MTLLNRFQEQEYTKKLDLNLWKRLFSYLNPYKKRMVILFLMMAMLGLVDTLFAFISKIIIDSFVIPKTTDGLWLFTSRVGIVIILQGLVVWSMIRIAGTVETGVCYEIRKEGFKRLQELSLTYFDETPAGWIMSRMTSDIKKLGHTLSWGFIDISWAISTMIIMAVAMFFINWRMALVTLSTIPFLILVSVYFQRKILAGFRKVRKNNSQLTASISEGIMGAKTIKTLVNEKQNLSEFELVTQEFKNSAVHSAIISSLYTPIIITLGSIGTGLVLWYGGSNVVADKISYGTLVAFITFTVHFFEPVKQFARVFTDLQNAQASAERILSLIETKPDIVDSESVIKKYGNSSNPKTELWPNLQGNIIFRNVNFAYKNGESVLDSFNLDIKAGEVIALVGETGSGKSTIVNLACRFYEPTDGQILVDSVDYMEMPLNWLHSNLGYVLQQPHLFSGTVKDNIIYGRIDAAEEEIINAAKLVNAHDFIVKMEKGYDTEVGEGGSMLSTGQKQLISFARAILSNPKIFVLDEATSSVDTETEKIIQDAIQKILKGRTSFIIAHRLSTIRSADRILVIEDGKIVESGTHKELLKLKGYYYRLYTNQFLEEKEVEILGA